MNTDITNGKYCLYVRKSSESDERQAMSIDSQIKEMLAMAEREGLNILEIKRESFSAKQSGHRPVFNELLHDLQNGKFNAILTWAPDRLSRNAGDLGTLVDLMDINKLRRIRTFGQSFSNTPNEKFLLMILCSQAELENDNRVINVKRGIRAKCEMGWRPVSAPIKDHGIESNERAHFKNYVSYILRQGTLNDQDRFIRGLNIPLFVKGIRIYRRLEPIDVDSI